MNQQSTAEIIKIPKKEFAVIDFELTPEKITQMVKKYDGLKLVPGDKKSYDEVYKVYRKFAKARIGTDKRRKDLGTDARDFVSRVNSTAKDLLTPLEPYEKRFKAMLDEEDMREVRLETDRINKIDSLMEDLTTTIAAGLQYNIPSDEIHKSLMALQASQISSVDYQEKTEKAEILLSSGFDSVKTAWENRVKFEGDQAEQAKVKAAQEEEAKKLAKERAEFQAAQVAEREKQETAQKKLDAERKTKEAAAVKIAAQEAEKIRRDRETLEKEKAEIAAQKQAEKDAIALKALIVKLHTEALAENVETDRLKKVKLAAAEKARKEKLKNDRARAKLVKADKEGLIAIANGYDKYISNAGIPELKTKEAQKMALALVGVLKGTIHAFEESARDLV